MIAVVDYGCGNIRSVENALGRLGCAYALCSDPASLMEADRVILPGVGNAALAMANLRRLGLGPAIRDCRRPVLGICVGMQLMCLDSEEGNVECLGIFDAHVRKFAPAPDAKVPHMGWNAIANCGGRLFKGIPEGSFMYFVHSYWAELCPDTAATCRHGERMFSAALQYENWWGVQFHPEKSGEAGEAVLRNFVEM